MTQYEQLVEKVAAELKEAAAVGMFGKVMGGLKNAFTGSQMRKGWGQVGAAVQKAGVGSTTAQTVANIAANPSATRMLNAGKANTIRGGLKTVGAYGATLAAGAYGAKKVFGGKNESNGTA